MIDLEHEETKKLKAKMIEAFRAGYKIRPACDLVGIKRSRYDKWITRDASFSMACKQAKASFISDIIPKAIEKDPYKMLQTMYPEYQNQPDTVVNIDNRPLINAPTNQLLQLLKQVEPNASSQKNTENDSNSELDGKTLLGD